MEVRDLELFLTLSERLHFGEAAAAHHLSPSAVTRAIQRLEQHLDVALLERDNRKVQLTGAGREFRQFAAQTLENLRELQGSLTGDGAALSGEVSLFSSVTAAYTVLARILPVLRQDFPGLDIQLHTGDQAQALQRLSRGVEDVAISAMPDTLPADITFQSLTSSPLRLIAPRVDCPVSELLDAAGGNDIPWSQLPFIQPESGVVLQHVQRLFAALSMSPLVYARVSGNEAMVSMVGLGLGISLVPEIVLEQSPLRAAVRTLPLPVPLPTIDIGIATRTRHLSRPPVKALWTVAAAVYGAYDG